MSLLEGKDKENKTGKTRSSQQQWTTTDNLVEMFDVLPREIRKTAGARRELVELGFINRRPVGPIAGSTYRIPR